MDGIPAFDLWDSVIEVLHSSEKHPSIEKSIVRSREEVNNQASRNRVRNETSSTNAKTKRDNKREVDDDETRVPNPQSCAGLAV